MNKILLQLEKFKQTHNNLTLAETRFSRAKYEKIAQKESRKPSTTYSKYWTKLNKIFELDKNANEEKMKMFICENDIKFGILKKRAIDFGSVSGSVLKH